MDADELGDDGEDGEDEEDGLQGDVEEEEEGEGEEEEEDNEEDAAAAWVPGEVLEVSGGAAELQEVLERLEEPTMLAVHW